jgi:dipeptidase
VADPREAYVLEAAGHEWAVQRVRGAMGISNTRSLFANYDRVSATAEPRAREQGWWPSAERPGRGGPGGDGDDGGQAEQFDFGAAYGPLPKPDGSPARVVLRGVRSCALLGRRQGEIDVRTMMATLRDHGEGLTPDEPFQDGVPDAPSICMHYGRVADGHVQGPTQGNTAASLVADLCADGSRLPVYWCSFYSPCLGIFFPVFSEGELPAVLSAGGPEPDEPSPWWRFREIERAARGPAGVLAPDVVADLRRTWRPLQEEFLESAYAVAAEGRQLLAAGHDGAAAQLLTGYMAGSADQVLATARGLHDRLAVASPARVPVLV